MKKFFPEGSEEFRSSIDDREITLSAGPMDLKGESMVLSTTPLKFAMLSPSASSLFSLDLAPIASLFL